MSNPSSSWSLESKRGFEQVPEDAVVWGNEQVETIEMAEVSHRSFAVAEQNVGRIDHETQY